jgi:hypothetical protein
MITFRFMANPFQFGRELAGDELVDRTEEVDEVIRTINTGGKLFIIGPRRFGKTSILKAASDKAAKAGTVVLRYDVEAYPTIGLLVSAIVAGAATACQGTIQKAGAQVKKFFGRLRPEVSFNVTQTSWSVKLGAAPRAGDDAAEVDLLVDALNGLEKMAANQAGNPPVGLILDEFQKIFEIGGPGAEAQVRAAIQQHKYTGYVFAGSKTRMPADMTTNASRPFYRLGSSRFIGHLPRADFEQFLRRSFSEGGFRIKRTGKSGEPGAIELILDLAEEVPYNVQLLAHTCWEQVSELHRAGSRTLTHKAVLAALDSIVRQYDPFYTQLWNGLTVIQQKTLLAVISEDGVSLQSMKVANAIGKGPATVRAALGALVTKEIIREEGAIGVIRFRFEDPFFKKWLELFAAQP